MVAQAFECRREVGRDRAADRQRCAAVRMSDGDAAGVQQMARRERSGIPAAVQVIADQRMAEPAEVHADLMAHAGGNLDVHQRAGAEALERTVARERRARVRIGAGGEWSACR